jgi:putative SOS response-associated peptidase YedK
MCGRYRLTAAERFKERFEVENDLELSPRFNIAPTQQVAVVRQDRERPVRQASMMRWGLIPYWAKDPAIGNRLINARSESIVEKPAYRDAFRDHRCLIAADGFYEWQRRAAGKQPFNFGMTDDSLFAFAGIWDRWKSPTGERIETCCILTTAPNSLLLDVHDRMPVILKSDSYDLWLDPWFKRTGDLAGLLQPFPSDLMKWYPVSTRVNDVANDDADCAAHVRPTGVQASLF